MKITDYQTFVVANPAPHHGGIYWIFVKLTTDSGIAGYGEVYSVPFHPHTVEHMIADVCNRHVVGANPFEIERLWRVVFSSGYTQRPDISLMGVLSGIETACWDIVGKELGKPVADLLGGRVRERLRSYTYIYPDQPEDSLTISNYPEGDEKSVYTDADMAAERASAYVR